MQHPSLRLIPPGLVKFFAAPYVAGDSLEKAMNTAADLMIRCQLYTTLDLLAENISSETTVANNLQIYMKMLEAAASDSRFPSANLRPSISLKPSSYTVEPLDSGGSAKGSRDTIFKICENADRQHIAVTVDMESSAWTDFTLNLVRELHAQGHQHVGTVIQTRLNRSEADLNQLPKGCRVRLVIGIYQEPADIALIDKRTMKERLLSFAKILLERGHYVEFATHDTTYIRRFVDEIVPEIGAKPDQFELQMLFGVPLERLQQELIERDFTVRLYVPFACGWPMAIAYLRRRLDEYPTMMFSVAKNLLTRPFTNSAK